MKSLKVADLKDFMSKLFTGSVFDNFLVKEAKIKTFFETSIDGTRVMEYYPEEEREKYQKDYCAWSEVKNICYQLIKGNRLPVNMNFILVLSDENMNKMNEKAGIKIPESEKAKCILNIRYDSKECRIVTATARSGFSLDRSFEEEWDKTMEIFFKHYQIPVEND